MKRTMKRTIKKLSIALLVMVLATPVRAQIFLDDNAKSDRSIYTQEEIGIMPYHEVEYDQGNYTPMGSGLLLLATLGGAYLLGRKRSKD